MMRRLGTDGMERSFFAFFCPRNEIIGARPRDTANDDGDDDDDKDPTTLTSTTTNALCETFFIAAAIGLTVDDGV